MGKILFGVFSGVFVGAVIYEFINRVNSGLVRKEKDIATHKIDEMSGVNHDACFVVTGAVAFEQ